jgi:anti-anti-sigma factor
MPIHIEYIEDSAILFLQGDINQDESRISRELIESLIDNEAIKNAVVDMQKTTSIGSTAIGMLFKLYKHISARSGYYKIVKIPPRIKTIFHEAHFDDVIPME